ncbi:MAG: class I SAM-dependent methyltransferase [Myxococcales bacterium]|nr:class I SAM-dependent methyltransferase [Myxococcales bacterium]
MPDHDDHDERYGEITARFYDGAYAKLRTPSGDAAFYHALARETGGPVLELGCGTGRTLLPIAKDGIACTGLDASPAMLAAFAAKDPPACLRLVEGRMQDFDLGEDRFALVTAPFRAFQHLQDVDDQLACLARVKRHLVPGGAFAFDCFDPRLDRIALREEPESEDARFRDGDDEIVRTTAVTREHAIQRQQVRMHYTRLRDGQVVSRERSDFAMRWFFRYELEHLLARAGFVEIRLFGDFDCSPYGADSNELIFVARRPV